MNGKLHDFRLVHPYASQEAVFAIELKQQVFFPLQDFRHHICALQKEDGALAQWVRYSAFGKEELFGETMSPWRFANRRAIAGLLLFTHRFYNPELRRWQTTDPLGFEDGMNLYRYVHNNPFYYRDPDGQFAWAVTIPIFEVAFGAALSPIILPTAGVLLGVAAAVVVYNAIAQIDAYADHMSRDRDEELNRKRFDPDPKAEGDHTTIRTDPETGEVTHYETFKPQTNPRDPKPWESEKRYDGKGKPDHNKELDKPIPTPHVHDPKCPGGIRPAEPSEIPKQGKP